MPLARQTAYEQIAADLRRAINDGRYEPMPDDPERSQLPSAAELGQQYGVSQKTAARAIQQLVTEGLAQARSGMRATALPRRQRPARWPMTGRYARAREAGGLVFGTDTPGGRIEKRITRTGWVLPPSHLAAQLGVDPEQRVWARERIMLIDDNAAELSISYFPAHATHWAPELMSEDSFPAGGVVGVLERAGHPIVRTTNEVRARLAIPAESEAFHGSGVEGPTSPPVVLEVSHITYDANDQPLEAVVSVRPAEGNIVAFETDESPEQSNG